ncbi:MAG TPA: MBL fold metallo-hydrolase [Burkholderiales bacterium]|nr:MBL fold metallo-hydrolase [Burkholderiales bacterium]
MQPIAFIRQFEPEYGHLTRVTPLIRRLVAHNDSPFTAWGTGTYVIGNGAVAVIDPGPDDAAHIDTLLAGLSGEKVSHIFVTHTHRDHSPGARLLKARTGAPILGCGPHGLEGETVEAGADHEHVPDRQLFEGNSVAGSGWTLETVFTPGHTSNHLCFALAEEKSLFTGDHVMGWSTSVISPPDGDMTQYMASLAKLLPRTDRLYYPTHGAPIPAPQAYVQQLIGHRLEREGQILACLAEGPQTIEAMVARLYADVDPRLHRAAARSVLAHLQKLLGEDRVAAAGEAPASARYSLLA